VVSREQLRALGFTEAAIAHRVRRGRLHRIHRGVYAVGYPELPPLGREVAALLACGPAAVLSHRSAAGLLYLLPFATGPVEVTTAGAGSRSHVGVRVHRSRRVGPQEKTWRQGLPVTTTPRTLLDLAETVGPTHLEQAVAEAKHRRLVTAAALLAYLDGAHGRRGVPRVRAVLEREGGPAFTRSVAERRLLSLLRTAGLPAPQVNASLAGYEVDFLWARERVVAEVDGYAYHSSRGAFERDRRRDADLGDLDHRVIRFTWLQLRCEPLSVVARLAGALAVRAAGHSVGDFHR
jgi:very-short-patch-repair endonuclease